MDRNATERRRNDRPSRHERRSGKDDLISIFRFYDVIFFQTFDGREETIHVQSLKGYFRDDLPIDRHSMFTSYWWSQRFFWQRSLAVIPHAIVFVFDGSLEPFLAGESLPFFKRVFEDCTNLGKKRNSGIHRIRFEALAHVFDFGNS